MQTVVLSILVGLLCVVCVRCSLEDEYFLYTNQDFPQKTDINEKNHIPSEILKEIKRRFHGLMGKRMEEQNEESVMPIPPLSEERTFPLYKFAIKKGFHGLMGKRDVKSGVPQTFRIQRNAKRESAEELDMLK